MSDVDSLRIEPARYSHWVRLAYWLETEAACLIVGLDPDRTLKIEKFLRPEIYTDAYRTLHRSPDLRSEPTPLETVEWAIDNNFDVAPELIELVHPQEQGDTSKSQPEIEFDENIENVTMTFEAYHRLEKQAETAKKYVIKPREIEINNKSALLMIYIMSKNKYGFDGNKSHNTATSFILNDLSDEGLLLTDTSVRNWLKKAFEYAEREKSRQKIKM